MSVILITGRGGVGKTTVAFEVCRRLEDAGDRLVVDTSGRTVDEVAQEILDCSDWLRPDPDR